VRRKRVSNVGKLSAIYAVTILVMVGGSPALGQSNDRPFIVEARVFRTNGTIVGDITCGGLFSDQVVGTVESGLPAVVELLYTLKSGKGRIVDRGLHVLELRHDIWENTYLLTKEDTTLFFRSFEGMGLAVEHLQMISLIPIQDVDPTVEYSIEFLVAVHPLRGREQERIAGWVGENVRGDDGGSSRSQMLNLNDLIEHFFAREKSVANRSDWYRTTVFTPGRLPLAGEVKE